MNATPKSGPMQTVPMAGAPAVSVVIPAHNEAANLATLIPEIAASLGLTPHEIVIVDDASTDDTPALIDRLAAGGIAVRRLKHPRSLGQSAAVMTFENEIDRFHVRGREVYWLCRVRQSDFVFSTAAFERNLRTRSTWRGLNTVKRLAAKYGVLPS